MSQSDFESKIRGIIHTIRVAIKPELAIPSDEANHPINYRIQRLRTQLDELKKMHEQISSSINNVSTNLEGLLEEINPSLERETNTANPTSDTEETKEPQSKETKEKTKPKKAAPKKTPKKAADKDKK